MNQSIVFSELQLVPSRSFRKSHNAIDYNHANAKSSYRVGNIQSNSKFNSFEVTNDNNTCWLYHGTSTNNARRIMSHGFGGKYALCFMIYELFTNL